MFNAIVYDTNFNQLYRGEIQDIQKEIAIDRANYVQWWPGHSLTTKECVSYLKALLLSSCLKTINTELLAMQTVTLERKPHDGFRYDERWI